MRQHTEALVAKIRAVPALASKTYVGTARKNGSGALPTVPFVVVYSAEGIDTQERLSGPRSAQHPRFTLHIVGSSEPNVQDIAAAVKARFVVGGFGVPPLVAGEVTSELTWESPLPIQWDHDVTPSVPYQVVEVAFTAEPA